MPLGVAVQASKGEGVWAAEVMSGSKVDLMVASRAGLGANQRARRAVSGGNQKSFISLMAVWDSMGMAGLDCWDSGRNCAKLVVKRDWLYSKHVWDRKARELRDVQKRGHRVIRSGISANRNSCCLSSPPT